MKILQTALQAKQITMKEIERGFSGSTEIEQWMEASFCQGIA
ncbi:MAG: hypothetical protein AB4426_23475 [Xenococcaceae cyanobacterium]